MILYFRVALSSSLSVVCRCIPCLSVLFTSLCCEVQWFLWEKPDGTIYVHFIFSPEFEAFQSIYKWNNTCICFIFPHLYHCLLVLSFCYSWQDFFHFYIFRPCVRASSFGVYSLLWWLGPWNFFFLTSLGTSVFSSWLDSTLNIISYFLKWNSTFYSVS